MKPLGNNGFTLPELLSVIIVSGLFSGLILFFGFSYWRYASLLEADLDTLVTRLNAGDFLRENIGASSGMINQNSITDSNTENPDPDYPSNLYWLPIHAIPGNTVMPTSGNTSPLVYFKRPAINSTGAIDMNGEQPYEDEYVLYLDGTTRSVMVRTLANPNVADNKATTSCPPALATSSCPADRVLIADVDSIDMRFFSRTGTLIDWTSVYDSDIAQYVGPDYPSVEVIEFTINIAKKALLQTDDSTFSSTIIRIALRNT